MLYFHGDRDRARAWLSALLGWGLGVGAGNIPGGIAIEGNGGQTFTAFPVHSIGESGLAVWGIAMYGYTPSGR